MGGGQLVDAAQLLVVQPVLWAALIGLSLNALAVPLPGSVAAVSAALAPANKPLMLLSAGMMLQLVPPQPRQVGDGTCRKSALSPTACTHCFLAAPYIRCHPVHHTRIGFSVAATHIP